MGDGSKHGKGVTIGTYSFPLEDINRIVEVLTNKYLTLLFILDK
jgi:hypothetical protein